MELLLGFFGFMFMLMRFGLRTAGENGYRKYVNDIYEKKKKYVEEHSDPELEQEYAERYNKNSGDFRELYYLLISKEDWIKTHGTRRDKIVFDLWKVEANGELKRIKERNEKYPNETYMQPDDIGFSNFDYKCIVFPEHVYSGLGILATRAMYILLSLHGKVTKYQAECDAEGLFDDKKIKDIKRYGYRCYLMTPKNGLDPNNPEYEGIYEKFPSEYPEMFV